MRQTRGGRGLTGYASVNQEINMDFTASSQRAVCGPARPRPPHTASPTPQRRGGSNEREVSLGVSVPAARAGAFPGGLRGGGRRHEAHLAARSACLLSRCRAPTPAAAPWLHEDRSSSAPRRRDTHRPLLARRRHACKGWLRCVSTWRPSWCSQLAHPSHCVGCGTRTF